MKKGLLIVAATLVVAVLTFLVTTASGMFEAVDVPTVRWTAEDEIPVAEDVDPLAASATENAGEREILEDRGGAGARVETILRGRVVEMGGGPIAGAEVCLQYRRTSRGRNRGRRQVLEHVYTGADGTFAFVGNVYQNNLAINLQVTHGTHAPTLVQRGFDEVMDEVDLGDIAMLGGGAVVGRVTDLAGNAIPGASLVLGTRGRNNPLSNAHDRRELLPTLESNGTGFFRLDSLMAAQYQIQASARNRQESGQRRFTIKDGEEHDIGDIQLGPGYQITGVVYAPDGTPVERTNIDLRTNRGRQRFRDRTDEAGRFDIEHIPPGTLVLSADRDGYLKYVLEDLDPAATPSVTIQLHNALRIRGTVNDAITGLPVERFAVRSRRTGELPETRLQRVQQGMEREAQTMSTLLARTRTGSRGGEVNQERVAQLQQRMMATERRMLAVTSQSSGRAVSDWPGTAGRVRNRKGGEFELTDLEEGVYVVDIQSPDHQRYRSEVIELRRADAMPELAVALPSGLTIIGQVVADEDSAPINRARVQLMVVATDARGRERQNRALETRTEKGGYFNFKQLPPGLSYALNTRASRHVTESMEPFVLSANRTDLEIRLTRTGVLEGVVLNIPPGRARNARVMLIGLTGSTREADVERDGTYRARDLVPGSYAVRAYLGRVRSQNLRSQNLGANVAIRAGITSTYNVPISPRPLGQVQGIVLNNGEPGRGFRATLQPLTPGAGRRNNSQTANGRGSFTFRDLALGSYQLTVRGAGRRGPELYRQTVQVTPEGRIELRVNLATAHLQVQVTAQDGAPADQLNGRFRLYAGITQLPQGPAAQQLQPVVNNVVRRGSFRAGTLPPGPYLMLVELVGHAPITQNILLRSGVETVLEVSAGDGR